MIRKIPFTVLQKAVYTLVKNGQNHAVWDDVPENEPLPYIKLGSFSGKFHGDKTQSIWQVTQQIHAWSDYEGKQEINEMLDDISTLISSVRPDLSADGFEVIDCDVDTVDAYEEIYENNSRAYHGVVVAIFTINQK